MTAIRELAPAKINLTLEVKGRRSDGLHEVASLVAFASGGDVLTFDAGASPDITVSGAFADQLIGTNILSRAVALIAGRAPGLRLGSVHLEKKLPVAAGIGGGSADAGALLRAVRDANSDASVNVDWYGIARDLGADVPVCFEARPMWMTGAGETLSEIAGGLPRLDAVLVNPMADVPADKTAQVYRALAAGLLPAGYEVPPAPRFSDRAALLDFMRSRGNQLARAAETVVPEIGVVLGALGRLPGVEYAALSGGGPTCFAIFADRETAEAARQHIAAEHPKWWVEATQLG